MTDKQKIVHLKQKIKQQLETINELEEVLGITKNRKEYMEAVQLWRKDTGESNLTYPDLGMHWKWALKYIYIGMKVCDAKGMLIDACKKILYVFE